MRLRYIWLGLAVILFASCKKDHSNNAGPGPGHAEKHILLKDITVPNLPDPYYHFEYNTDSMVTKADFASNYTMYDVFYSGSKISEMRNNILVNHDTLRYSYDASGKVTMIKFINALNVIYRVVFFKYASDHLQQIEWDQKVGDVGYIIDRTLSFTYYPDGNVKEITDHRPPMDGVAESITVKTLEGYDDKVNVDDFTLVHDGIHDHLFLFQGFRLQKNNPGKETLSVNGTNLYTVNFTYTYNKDNTPANKAGDFVYLSGQYAGQRFQTNTYYTYY